MSFSWTDVYSSGFGRSCLQGSGRAVVCGRKQPWTLSSAVVADDIVLLRGRTISLAVFTRFPFCLAGCPEYTPNRLHCKHPFKFQQIFKIECGQCPPAARFGKAIKSESRKEEARWSLGRLFPVSVLEQTSPMLT